MVCKMETAALMILVVASGAAAQEEPRQQQRDPARNAAPGQPVPSQTGPAVMQQLDTHVANCLLLGNQEEIALCRFAMDKIETDDVKDFAKMLVEDHEKFVSKLRKFTSRDQSFELRSNAGGEKASRDSDKKDGVRQASGTDEDRRPQRNPATGTTTAGGAQPGTNDLHSRLTAIKHQAAQECLRLTEECLSKQEGKDFDKAFLGQQVGGHIQMMAELKAVENHVSPELRELVRDGQKTTKEHKEKAEKLMKNLTK